MFNINTAETTFPVQIIWRKDSKWGQEGGDPSFPTMASPPSPTKKTVTFLSSSLHQHVVDMNSYSSLQLPEFSGTTADFDNWQKDVKTEMEGLVHGTEYLTDAAYCTENKTVSKVLVSRLKRALKSNASLFMENIDSKYKANLAEIWKLLHAEFQVKEDCASCIITLWQRMCDLSVTNIDDIPTFTNSFKKVLANLTKEKLPVDNHDYPIII